MRKIFISALAALAFAGAAAPAAATETVAISVDFSDLDLAESAHVAELQERVTKAAREACGRPESRAASAIAATQACQSELIARANTQIAEIRIAMAERPTTFASR